MGNLGEKQNNYNFQNENHQKSSSEIKSQTDKQTDQEKIRLLLVEEKKIGQKNKRKKPK